MARGRPAALAALICIMPGGLPAGTNLPSPGYPSHDCGTKPETPERASVFISEAELEAYNAAVDVYNHAMAQYVACIQRFADNAASDIREIQRKAKAAIEAVND